jgi:hypothetical protein
MPDTQGLPWPEGEPGALRASAHRASALAHQLSGLHGGVAATHAAGWSGTAAAAFGATVRRDAGVVAAAGAAFGDAAGALNDLAGAIEHARQRVLHAADRLRAAREHAAAASRRAADARSAADAAHQAAALDPTASLGSPLFSAADIAEGDAQRAEAASAAAQDELARVAAWAHREAEDACHDARAADQRCAGVLEASAGTSPFASTGMPGGAFSPAAPLAASAGMAGISQLGQYLAGDLYNFWSGGHDRNFPFGTGLKAGVYMKGVNTWVRQDWTAWQRVAKTAGSTPEEIADAKALALSRLPTFNNGLIGRNVAKGLSRFSATEDAGAWLGTASKATPWFRGLGIAGGAVSTGIDAYGLWKQGSPIKAFQKRGAGYVADVGKTAFSASSTAFMIAPNPITGGAVVVSGAVWLGAEGWEHRKQIGHAIASGADWAWDHSAVGAAWNHRQEIGAALDKGVDTIGDGLSTAGDKLADAGSSVVHVGGDVVDGAKDLVDKIPTPW